MRRPGLGSLWVLVTTLPAVGQVLTPNASAVTALTVTASGGTTATAPPGTQLFDGFLLRSGGGGGGTHATVLVGLTADPATGIVAYTVSDFYAVTAVGATGLFVVADSGPHETVLNLVAPSPTPAVVRITWTHLNRWSGDGAFVDVGADGTIDWQGHWQDPSAVLQLRTVVGPFGQRLRTRTFAHGSLQLIFERIESGTGNSTLRIEVAPHRGALAVAAGETFAPVVFRFADDNGQPVAGEPVTFQLSGAGSLTGPATVQTDGQGLAAANVTSLPGGGRTTIVATVPGLGEPVSVRLFAQSLVVVRLSANVLLGLHAYEPQPATVAYVVLVSPPGTAPLAMTFGPVCTNPLDPNTLVLEDSMGLFGFVSASGTGAVGTPGLVKNYVLPRGMCAGVTVLVQAIGFDAAFGVLRTNCASLTL